MMNWDDIRVFLEVSRSGGLSAAKDRLKMDAATVGRRINRLETAQGTVLFQRSQQGYSLTAAGQALLDHVEAAEVHLKTGLAALPQHSDQLTGTVRIGAPDGCANYVLPQVCVALREQHPELELQIVALPRLFNLSRREADMVIGVSMPTASRLLVQKICTYELHLAAAQGVAEQVRDIAGLKTVPIVGYIPDMIFDRELDYGDHFGLRHPDLSSNSIAVQMNLIRAKGGVGVTHRFAMPFFPDLTPILPEKTLNRNFYLIRAQEDKTDLRLSRIAGLLSAATKTEVDRLEKMVV